MRRLALFVFALGLLAAACSDDSGGRGLFDTSPSTSSGRTTEDTSTQDTSTQDTSTAFTYPDAIVDGYIEGCSPDGGAAFCRCSIDEFQRRMPLEDFLVMAEGDIESSPIALDIVTFCLTEVGTGSDTTTGTTGATGTTTGTTEATDTTGGFVTITDMATIIDLSIQDLELFWADVMPGVWGADYFPVASFGPYFISQGDVPECGGPLSEESYVQNAFYCSLDDTVQWDAEQLMAPLFQDFGDFTVALVMAHEWGHAVQERFGFDDFLPTIVSELQADCLAGAWTGFVEAEQSDLLRLEPGDLEEAMAGFLLIGDQLGSAPEGVNAHGGSFDRLNAFFEGLNQGATQCATYEDTPPQVIFIPLAETDDPVQGGDLPLADTPAILGAALEVFWGIVYPDTFGQPWTPVGDMVPYAPSSGNFPACGGTVFDQSFYAGNAFYCSADNYFAWDDEGLFPDLYTDIGDFAIGLVMSNEWGRAVQVRAGLPTEGVGPQLQVDCLTGVWTAALTFDDNPMELFLSAGDLEEGIAGFLQLSATPGTEGAAGAFDRFEAFKDGFFFGSDACGI